MENKRKTLNVKYIRQIFQSEIVNNSKFSEWIIRDIDIFITGLINDLIKMDFDNKLFEEDIK